MALDYLYKAGLSAPSDCTLFLEDQVRSGDPPSRAEGAYAMRERSNVPERQRCQREPPTKWLSC